jgi:chromosome segregation protein
VQREALDAEEARARDNAEGLRLRIVQTTQDMHREQALDRDAESALTTLAQETSGLESASARADDELVQAEEDAAALNEALAECEQMLERLTAELAEWNASKASHERAREVASALVETSTHQLGEAAARLDQAMEGALETPDVLLAQSATEQARELATHAREALTLARHALEDAERAETEARGPLEVAEREAQMLSAEAKALADLLQPEGQGLWPPMVDAVTVQPGYEAALAAALGDDLQAPLDEAAPHHWRDLGDFDSSFPLPAGAKALKDFVKAPAALDRRLTMTGVVFPDQGAA